MAVPAATEPASSPAPELQPPVTAWLLQQAGTEILREVITACDSAAIPVLAVKGVVTSRLLYGDVAERPITDVDVRVRPRDLRRLQQVAASSGWRCARVAWSYRNLVYDFGSLSLDVEGCVGPRGLCGLDVDTMLERSERLELVPGLRCPVPEIHDHAVLLTVNVFKDKIVTAPAWAVDDLERIVVHPTFRSGLFVERLAQARIATLAWIVAGWMESTRRSAPWGAIRAAIESRARVRRGYGSLVRRGLRSAQRAPLSLRVLARLAADVPLRQAGALLWAAAWSAEMWLREGRAGSDRTERSPEGTGGIDGVRDRRVHRFS